MQKEIVAMILAGGRGIRLGALTKNLAKPAIPFGGKYRIIDFVLSNCSNSGIDVVGVLTQYKSLKLNQHIGTGEPWNLNKSNVGVTVLSSNEDKNGTSCYKGTANAVFQNKKFIDNFLPTYVLILSGDQIYKMDYSKMLNFHKAKKADATIAVIKVQIEEASRYGIMNTDEDLLIREFEEKPKVPKGNLASMGIYIFNWGVLKYYLEQDEKNKVSNNDFGLDIIPKIIEDKLKVYAYPFYGYWRDVGTIQSLWESNMDLLKSDSKINLNDERWEIYSNSEVNTVQHIGTKSVIKNSLVLDGCFVEGTVLNSIVSQGTKIGKNSKIINSVLMPNVNIEEDVVINKAIIASETVITKGLNIGDGHTIVVIEGKDIYKN